MRYNDLLYGAFEPSSIISKLTKTDRVIRSRNVTMSVLPNFLILRGPLPSRFQHGMGVAYLMGLVVNNNPCLEMLRTLLEASALLHDVGSPPFSHLSEHFLKERTGKDGEAFLADILQDSETAVVLGEFGISIKDVVEVVTGKSPVANVLCGSIDLDNLDNIKRHIRYTGLFAKDFDNLKIAQSFVYNSLIGRWGLNSSCYQEVEKWKKARLAVYGPSIYGEPHLNVATMIYRAVELAYCENKLSDHFFLLDDHQAIDYLLQCSWVASELVEKALRWEWYSLAVDLFSYQPSEKILKFASHWSGRKQLADGIAEKLGVDPNYVCVYIGKGREGRRVELPFVHDGNWELESLIYQDDYYQSKYRVKVYVPEELEYKGDSILDFVKTELEFC